MSLNQGLLVDFLFQQSLSQSPAPIAEGFDCCFAGRQMPSPSRPQASATGVDTAVSEPVRGRPVPIRGPSRGGYEHGEIDPASFDLLSRSLTSAGPFLEPEASENAMLRPTASVVSNPNPRRSEDADDAYAYTTTTTTTTLDDDADEASEESPLIRHHTASTVRSTTSAAASPFLNNTSPTRFWFIFSQVLLAYFISCFDGTIMASSHPVITSYFHAANSASWLSTAFLLTSTAFQPLLGRLSDAVGRKPLFVGCLGVFALATTCCALAGSIESFILARAACGMGAGGVMTLGSIIVSDLVPIE